MSGRESAGFRVRGRFVIALAALLLCAGAAVATARLTAATVTTHKGKLGRMLAASNGHTLYLFTGDTKNKSNCTGSCTQTWHPLMTHGRPVAAKGSGVNSRLLARTHRSGSDQVVTYNGHPLYTFSGDKKAGQMAGENRNQFGGRWYAVSTRGNALKPKTNLCGYGCYG